MADIFTKKKRSEVMSRIRSRGNEATEMVLARLFRQHHVTGWRRHRQIRLKLPTPKTGLPENVRKVDRGIRKIRRPETAVKQSPLNFSLFKVRPDFVFPKSRLAVFVDGCFWHGCPKHGTKPKGNGSFWSKKLARNKHRDLLVTGVLRRARWRVVRIWEHELSKQGGKCLRKIQAALDRGKQGTV